MKFRTLRADEIDLRVGAVGDGYYTLLLYKDARCDQNILDETVGEENWQRDHKEIKNSLYGGVGIWSETKQQWVWKWDCGTESNTEKEKGEASDSFKRACVNWGIGRELYTAPNVYINCVTQEEKDEKGRKKYTIKNFEDIKQSKTMRVKEIEYNDKREIVKLVIVDKNGVQVFPVNRQVNLPVAEKQFEQVKQETKHLDTNSNVCVECGDNVSQKVADYSISKYGKVLCFECQKNGLKEVEI